MIQEEEEGMNEGLELFTDPELQSSVVEKITKTGAFIVPLCFSPDDHKVLGKWFINASLWDEDTSEVYKEGYLFILLKTNAKIFDQYKTGKFVYNVKVKPTYEEFCAYLRTLKNYIGDYSILSQYFDMFIYKIPEKWEQDYKYFLQGSYSKMSKEAQLVIIRSKSKNTLKIVLRDIFQKSPKLKAYWEDKTDADIPEDAEVWPKPEKTGEVFSNKIEQALKISINKAIEKTI